MADICNDDRFEMIKWIKERLVKGTNIEGSPEEMKVIDSILFRFWQLGWLTLIDKFTLDKDCTDEIFECSKIIGALTELTAGCNNGDLLQLLSEAHHKFIKYRETRTVNKPVFKVGDIVRSKNDKDFPRIVIEHIDDSGYYGDTTNFDIADQDEYELVEAADEQTESEDDQFFCEVKGYKVTYRRSCKHCPMTKVDSAGNIFAYLDSNNKFHCAFASGN